MHEADTWRQSPLSGCESWANVKVGTLATHSNLGGSRLDRYALFRGYVCHNSKQLYTDQDIHVLQCTTTWSSIQNLAGDDVA